MGFHYTVVHCVCGLCGLLSAKTNTTAEMGPPEQPRSCRRCVPNPPSEARFDIGVSLFFPLLICLSAFCLASSFLSRPSLEATASDLLCLFFPLGGSVIASKPITDTSLVSRCRLTQSSLRHLRNHLCDTIHAVVFHRLVWRLAEARITSIVSSCSCLIEYFFRC